jgi:hypothetical protein
MVVLFIVVANMALRCLGARWCEEFDSVALVRMWEVGGIELMFEIPGVIKIYRRVSDKFPGLKDKE